MLKQEYSANDSDGPARVANSLSSQPESAASVQRAASPLRGEGGGPCSLSWSCGPVAGAPSSLRLPPSRSEGDPDSDLTGARTESSPDAAARDPTRLSSVSSLVYPGAEPPPRLAASMKAGKAGCKACLQNLRDIRTVTNRQFAMRKRKGNRPRTSDGPAPQHNYNTRARKKHKQKQKERKKRKRPDSPPLQGPEIPGVNFPT